MCRTLSHDPLALDPNCIHIVDAQVFAGSTYHLVASDDNDFNALLPAWGIREAYIGAGNTLASVRLPPAALCSPCALPAEVPGLRCRPPLVLVCHVVTAVLCAGHQGHLHPDEPAPGVQCPGALSQPEPQQPPCGRHRGGSGAQQQHQRGPLRCGHAWRRSPGPRSRWRSSLRALACVKAGRWSDEGAVSTDMIQDDSYLTESLLPPQFRVGLACLGHRIGARHWVASSKSACMPWFWALGIMLKPCASPNRVLQLLQQWVDSPWQPPNRIRQASSASWDPSSHTW